MVRASVERAPVAPAKRTDALERSVCQETSTCAVSRLLETSQVRGVAASEQALSSTSTRAGGCACGLKKIVSGARERTKGFDRRRFGVFSAVFTTETMIFAGSDQDRKWLFRHGGYKT